VEVIMTNFTLKPYSALLSKCYMGKSVVRRIRLVFKVKSVIAIWQRMRTSHIDEKEMILPLSLREVVEVFNENPNVHLSKYDFEQYEITGIRQLIFRLKAKGAIIETIYQTKIDNDGKSYSGIACYSLVGWVP